LFDYEEWKETETVHFMPMGVGGGWEQKMGARSEVDES
jgi:hypothetical protein